MASPAVTIRELSKVYVVSEREAGVAASFKSPVHRHMKKIPAVDGITFDLASGEIVGFLGPNGAGKTTTLKMLSGLLHPTAGEVAVLGFVPWKRDREYLRRITLVMGQRNQLIWDIPPQETFELNRAIYSIPIEDYRRMLTELTDLLDLGPLLRKPVRNLSLGERMKCEIAAALLHRPRVVFLDEPTIGLDVTMQRRIRTFIAEYNPFRHVVFGVIQDVTEHKRAEENLRRSEERYRVILGNMEEAYYELDIHGNMTFFSAITLKALGYANEEMQGMNFSQYVDPGCKQYVIDVFSKIFLTGETIKGFEWLIVGKDGRRIPVETSASLVRDSDGNPVGFRGVTRDVSPG